MKKANYQCKIEQVKGKGTVVTPEQYCLSIYL